MNRSVFRTLLLLGFGLLATRISGQTPSARMDSLAEENGKAYQQNYQKALRLARRHQWIISQTTPEGVYLSLQGVTETNQPIYYITDNNTRAAATTRTNQLWSGGSLGLTLSGSNPALTGKLGIWDGGWVSNTHQELARRVVQRDEGNVSDPATGSTHATHVAGTLMASGRVPIAQGMAYGFTGLQSYNFSNDLAEMAGAASKLLISNHSYGEIAGWRQNTGRSATTPWEWNGDSQISETEDYRFGFYDVKTRQWDEVCFNAPYYLPVKSSGNNRDQNGPPAGRPYWRRNQNGNYTYVASRPANLSSNNGYDNIPTYGVAKNILTVGAVAALSQGSNQPLDIQMASFSSWGPTDDGRIKPDLVANGINVLSCISTANDAYETLSGTSMSTPNVAGSLLLLQEYYFQQTKAFMRAATLKGLAIHTADEAGEAPGPDYRFGWGLLNAEKAARMIGNAEASHQIQERQLKSKETHEWKVVASGKGPLVVTISWTDPPAQARSAAKGNVNNRTPLLVNDLDVRVSDGTTEFLPWILNPANPARAATPGDNIRDNVENIRIAHVIPGKVYTIRVSHKGALKYGFQAYSVLVSGIGGNAYCTSQAQSTAEGRIESVALGTLRSESVAGCTAYTDFTHLQSTASAGQQLPLTIRVGSCGNAISQIVKAYADWNADGDFTDGNETLATSGVLTGNATLQTTVSIPAGLTPGQMVRVRMVSVASTNPADVQPCGNYGKGETEEYVLTVVEPDTDLGITAILSPEFVGCTDDFRSIQVRVKNFGTAVQRNIPVTVQVRTGTTLLATLTGLLTDSLAAFEEGMVTVSPDFQVLSGNEYTFVASAEIPGDQDASNNQLTIRRSPALTSVPLAHALFCDDRVQLSASVQGTTYWYASPTSTEWIAAGNSTFTTVRTSDSIYYAGVNDLSGALGPKSKQAFEGGSYSDNFGPQPLLTTWVPLVIKKARLYIGTPGKLTFTAYTSNGIPVSSVVLDVAATRNANTTTGTVTGQLADDLTDEGQVYDLNLTLPTPGKYKIEITYENGASIFRSNRGVSGYPYTLPDIMQLTGAVFGADTITNAYYYLYDMQVNALNCPAPRIAVKAVAATGVDPAPTATLSSSGNVCRDEKATLSIQLSGTGPWNLVYRHNDQLYAIPNITTSPYLLTDALVGTYQVTQVGDATHCPVPQSGDAVAVQYHPQPDALLTTAGSLLTAGDASQYRWFLNNILIDTATRRTLIARKIGRYSVEVTSANGCSARSSAVAVDTIQTDDQLTGGWLRISPNPTIEQLTVYLGTVHQVARLQLFDATGKLLRQIGVTPEVSSIELPMSSYATGLYTVVLLNGTQRKAYRVIKLP